MATITKELFTQIIDALKSKGIDSENAWYEKGSSVFSYEMEMKTREIAQSMRDPNAVSCMQISVQDVREVAKKWLSGVPFEPLIIAATFSLKRKGDAYAATLARGGNTARNGGVFQIVDEALAYVYADTDKVLVLGKVSLEREDPRCDTKMCYAYKGTQTFIKDGWVRLKTSLNGDEVVIPLFAEDFTKQSVTRESATNYSHELNGRKYKITINF